MSKRPIIIKAVAEKIATEIMTYHAPDGPVVCTRMQSMLRQPDGTERILGGRDKASIVQVIADELLEWCDEPSATD